MWNWVAIALLAVSVVALLRVAIPATRVERASEPFANDRFNDGLGSGTIAAGVVFAGLALVYGVLPDAGQTGLQEVLLTFWPRPTSDDVRLPDLSGAMLGSSLLLIACGVGLLRRWNPARLLALALALFLFAHTFRLLVTWLPLARSSWFELPLVFVAGELILLGLAITVRQLGSAGMRRHYERE
jgi:hypothetical protein